MKLKKAIENLKAGREDAGMIPEEEYTQTIDLLIEAGKRIRDYRVRDLIIEYELLPGETKE